MSRALPSPFVPGVHVSGALCEMNESMVRGWKIRSLSRGMPIVLWAQSTSRPTNSIQSREMSAAPGLASVTASRQNAEIRSHRAAAMPPGR